MLNGKPGSGKCLQCDKTLRGTRATKFCCPACKTRHYRYQGKAWAPGAWTTCQNCPRKFRKARKNHRFCSDNCRRQYNRYGLNFTRLADHLSVAIAAKLNGDPQAFERLRAAAAALFDSPKLEPKEFTE